MKEARAVGRGAAHRATRRAGTTNKPLPSGRRLLQRLRQPVDGASVGIFRIGFGVALALHALAYLTTGRIERYWLLPLVRFPYEWLTWLEPLPAAGMRVLFWVLVAAALALAVGWHARLAALIFALGYGYAFLLDQATYNNHVYLVCLLALLVAVVPSGAACSLDARRNRHASGAAVPEWALWLLRFQIALPYVFGGLAKLNRDWLLRAQPMKIWLAEDAPGELRLDFLRHEIAAYAFSWGGLVFDLSIVPLLLWRRTRIPAFVAAVAFHLTNVFIFDIGVFPWLMIWATLLFFPPDWPRRARLVRPRRHPLPPPAGGPPTVRRLGTAVVAIYLALQLLLPFRHFLYPGWVDWTEEGHQFAWRMKLRDKRGTLRFVAVDPERRSVVQLSDVDDVLTLTQRAMMIHDPELVRQFAHSLAPRLAAAGMEGHHIHVFGEISLNGRPPQPLVDPEVALSLEPPARGAAPWIVPLRGEQ